MGELKNQAARLTQWCQAEALPFWAEHGIDPAGGFYETLKLTAQPNMSDLRRVRVQARQCYVYSHAAHLRWYNNAKQISDHGWKYLTHQGFQGAEDVGVSGFSGCAHLLNPDGSLHDAWRDTYAQAFLILAAAWRYRAFNDPEALNCLDKTLNFLHQYIKTDRGWLEGRPDRLPRRQNPHMHLFEAFLAAFEATQDETYLTLADELYALFETVFFDIQTHTVREFFTCDWRPAPEVGDLTEPGHMMEWCWLLYKYHRHRPHDAVIEYAEKLFQTALSIGVNPKTGLLVNECHISGKVTKSDSRLWSQTEFIKAGLARSRYGLTDKDKLTAEMIDRVFNYYLSVPKLGGWHDEIDARGNVISNTMPASTFYHIFCMASEAEKVA